MIEFFSENDFVLEKEEAISVWISGLISAEGFNEGDLSFVFCNDDFLHNINVEFLNHDTLTDIITFDYSLGKQLNGEIYISTERVLENAEDFDVSFVEELHRVISHGVLHLCGYKDKSEEEERLMRLKEDHALKSRNFVN